MTEAEAKALYAKLVLAFPAAPRAEGTERVYVEALEPWRQSDRGLEAVTQVIHAHRDARALPTIATLNEAYGALRERYAPAALPEAPMSEAQRKENLGQAYAYLKRLEGSVVKRMP